MEEWSSLCRCCLSTGSQTSLVQDEVIRNKFYETTTIEVKEEDGLPQRLCEDCLSVMNSAYQFKKQCLRIDSELKVQLAEIGNLPPSEEQLPMDTTTTKVPEDEEVEEDAIYPEVMIKTESPESDDDCYYVLVIDDTKDNKGVEEIEPTIDDTKIKEEKELNPATGELEFEKNVDAFLVMKPQEKPTVKEDENGTLYDEAGNQYHFSDDPDSNDSEGNSQIEFTENFGNPGALLTTGENGNIIKILTSNGTTENLLFKGDKGDEIVTYIVDDQLVSGESDGLSQEEVIVCEGDDSQFQIVNYDGSELVIEYADDCPTTTVVRQDDGSFLCSCGLQFTDFVALENHQIVHHNTSIVGNYLCSLCGKGFESNEILTGHMLLHTNSSAIIRCPYCQQYIKRNAITQHIKYSHNNIKPRCNLCDKTFANRNNLKRHMMIHSGIRQYECDICFKRFSQKITMQTHRLTHAVDPLFCVICEIRFESANELLAHQEQHESENASETIEVSTLKGKNLCYPCQICNKLFSVESALKYHIENFHTQDSLKLLCSECGEVLPNRKAMYAHAFTHKSSELGSKIIKIGKRFECKRCGKPCASQAMLIMHERVHTNERPFPCPLCALRFKTKTHLRTHQLTHTREKRFGCSVCMKFFALKGNLVVHLRTHTGERPYVCSLCNDAFIDSKYLKKHKLRKHAIDNVPWNQY